MTSDHRTERVVLAALAFVFVLAFVLNAWVVDDAYITFRVVDNLVHGRGLTWNPGERVQVFTHPLWMFLMSGAYLVTGDLFRTSVVVSLLCCAAALAVAFRWLRRDGAPWRPAWLLALLLSSKAVMDYTSSGLENPLSYLIATGFVALAGQDEPVSPRKLGLAWLVGSLAFLNRHDTLLLYLPILGWLTWRGLGRPPAFRPLLLGVLPAVVWVLFATWYFGFPLPNTYYAKVSTGVPLGDKLARGAAYFANSAAWDTASHLAVLAGLVLALKRRHRPALIALAGVGLYYVYILFHACTTHMSGRFFALPFFIAILWVAKLTPSRRLAVAGGAGLLLYALLNPLAPVKMGTRWYHPRKWTDSQLDTNQSIHQYGPHVFFGHRGDWRVPDHEWYAAGLEFRRRPELVQVGGPEGAEPVGYFGFAVGPGKIVLDYCGITDPLLARLPACNAASPREWKSGHFYRLPPEGYVDSRASGQNLIRDPGIREYYGHLERAVSDPRLMSRSRLATIVRLNTGAYDHLLDGYGRPALDGRDFRRVLREHLRLE